MARYLRVAIKELVSDVAVDPVHVKELADSIKLKGQLAPIIIREENKEVIDGFHRVAAMQELGFKEVDCVQVPCGDEEFWDFRIIQASMHKNVTFARAVDWIDKVFVLSPYAQKYKSAYSLFVSIKAPKPVRAWADNKAKAWGLATDTITNWLHAKQTMEPSLLEDIKTSSQNLSTDTYIKVARGLPTKPELQRPLLEKAAKEDLSAAEIIETAKALRNTQDKAQIKSILEQPVSRSSEELTRAAIVENLKAEVLPKREKKQYELTGLALEIYLHLDSAINNVQRLNPEVIAALTPNQKADMLRVVNELMTALLGLADELGGYIEGKVLKEVQS